MEFTLRPFTQNDLNALVKFANNPKIAHNLTNAFPYPYTKEHGERFINFASNTALPHRVFTIDIDGEASGGIGLHPKDDVYCKNAELGYWLAEPYWGKGIITKAIREIVVFGFANMNIERIFARPYGPNIASQRVLEKAGFKLEARLERTFFKNGEYLDELIYAVRK